MCCWVLSCAPGTLLTSISEFHFLFWPFCLQCNLDVKCSIYQLCLLVKLSTYDRQSFSAAGPTVWLTAFQTTRELLHYNSNSNNKSKVIWEEHVTNAPLVTMGCPKFTPKTALPLRRSPPKSNTKPDPGHHHKRHYGFHQPFCHNTLSGHTDRQTDGLGDRPVTWALRSLCW